MYRDDVAEKAAAADSRVQDQNCGQSMGFTDLQGLQQAGTMNTLTKSAYYSAPSMAELHGKSAAHHAEEADKNGKAQAFFATHPEFDEFIQLIRQGAVQI
jgi:hypothetical protein